MQPVAAVPGVRASERGVLGGDPAVIVCFVPGAPVPQGSKRAFVVKGRAVLADVRGADLKAWRDQVADLVASAGEGSRFVGAVRVSLVFQFVRPASAPRRVWPDVRPDVDKLTRAALDALTVSGVIEDDARIVRLVAEKRYAAEPGVWVTVAPMTTEDGENG